MRASSRGPCLAANVAPIRMSEICGSSGARPVDVGDDEADADADADDEDENEDGDGAEGRVGV